MAVATSTALAIGGLAVSAASTTKSFIDAGKQKKLQRQAQADAEAAMAEARKKLEVNYFDTLAVQKEPYELEREALLAQGAQAIQAGQETGRGAAATAGKTQMAMNEAQAGIRTAMGKEMTDIEKMQAQEESRLRDVGVQLDLGEAEGAQQAAADAQQAAAAATAQGMQGLTSTLSQGIQMVSLYPTTRDTRSADINKAISGTAQQIPSAVRESAIPKTQLSASALTPKPMASSMSQPFLQNNMGFYGNKSNIMMPAPQDAYNFFKFYQ